MGAPALLLSIRAYGGGRSGVGLASDKHHIPQVSAKHANQEKWCAERSDVRRRIKWRLCLLSARRLDERCMSRLTLPLCSPQALDVRGGESATILSARSERW